MWPLSNYFDHLLILSSLLVDHLWSRDRCYLVVDYPWSLTDFNAELPEELGTLLHTDTSSLGSAGTTVSAQNGIGSVVVR